MKKNTIIGGVEVETFYPKTKKAWRDWLMKNHKIKKSVWLIGYKKSSGKPSISWSESVDEALCFGWIDSVCRSIDKESYQQFFCPRKPKSVWSKINKLKVEELIAKNLMTEAGLATIEIAKQNGSWTILDEIEELIMPAELVQAFEKNKTALTHFESWSKSTRKAILQWLVVAKRKETREARITDIITQAAQNKKPKPFA